MVQYLHDTSVKPESSSSSSSFFFAFFFFTFFITFSLAFFFFSSSPFYSSSSYFSRYMHFFPFFFFFFFTSSSSSLLLLLLLLLLHEPPNPSKGGDFHIVMLQKPYVASLLTSSPAILRLVGKMDKHVQQDSFCFLRYHLRHRGHRGFKPPAHSSLNPAPTPSCKDA